MRGAGVAMASRFSCRPLQPLPAWLMPALLGALLVTLIIATQAGSTAVRAHPRVFHPLSSSSAWRGVLHGSSSSSSSRSSVTKLRRLLLVGARACTFITFAFVMEFDAGPSPRG